MHERKRAMSDTVSITTTDIRPGQPHEAAQAGLREWHRIIAALDWDRLPDLLAEEVVFRNPAAIESYHGKGSMLAILRAVFGVMQDFKYHRHFGRGTGYVLEFSARVGDAALLGADFVEFDAHGRIADFMVMMRPASVVLALAAEAGKRLADAPAPSSAGTDSLNPSTIRTSGEPST